MGVGLVAAPVLGLWLWSLLPGPGSGGRVALDWPAGLGARDTAERLAARGLTRSPRWFALYLRVLRPGFQAAAGPHLLNDRLSPSEIVARLERSTWRSTVKVTVPEGLHHVQIAERLQAQEICGAASFTRAANDRGLLRELGIRGPSAEGLLFPATYDFLPDSAPAAIIRVMVRTARERIERASARHAGGSTELREKRGWSEHELLTLASIVEKESAQADERPIIASVYLNRLDDPEFRPLRMLQADPTAGYGCVIAAAEAPSCAGYRGPITPAMLRDAANRYNTYQHPGLPPGPIANPGEAALEAVLAPAKTDYLFFVATGNGRHRFSRTLAEHDRAVRGQ